MKDYHPKCRITNYRVSVSHRFGSLISTHLTASIFAPLLAYLVASVAPANALEISLTVTDEMREMGCSMQLNGEIEPGDLEVVISAFERMSDEGLLEGRSDGEYTYAYLHNFSPVLPYGQPGMVAVRVCLNSEGGNLYEASKIAEYFRFGPLLDGRGIQTGVARGHICLSACSIIFLSGGWSFFLGYEDNADIGNVFAGKNSLLHPAGRLGFHAPYIPIGAGNYSVEELRQYWISALSSNRLIIEMIDKDIISMNNRLLADMLGHVSASTLTVDTVSDAVRWNIEVAPNVWRSGGLIFDVKYMLNNICANAMMLMPPKMGYYFEEGSSFQSEINLTTERWLQKVYPRAIRRASFRIGRVRSSNFRAVNDEGVCVVEYILSGSSLFLEIDESASLPKARFIFDSDMDGYWPLFAREGSPFRVTVSGSANFIEASTDMPFISIFPPEYPLSLLDWKKN